MMRVDLLIPGLPAKADHFLFGICSLLLLRDGKRNILFDCGPFRVRRGNSKMRCGDHWFQEPQDAPDG